MKNKSIICTMLILTTGLLQLKAQNIPAVYPSKAGIIVVTGVPLPHGSYYKIERSVADKEDFTSISAVVTAGSLRQFRGLILNYCRFFYPVSYDSLMIKSAFRDLEKNIEKPDPGYYMLHPAMQIASGTAWIDTSAKQNIYFKYRVTKVSPGGEKIIGTTEAIRIPSKGKLSPLKIRKKEIRPNNVYIEWFVAGSNKPSWFDVYRCQTEKTTFMKINTEKGFFNLKDTLILVVKDTLVRNEDNYEYYIQPSDYWGNTGDKSEIAKIATTTNQIMPVVLKFETKSIDKSKTIRLSWEISKYPYMRNISILRSESYNGKYTTLTDLPFSDTLYFDRQVDPVKTYYYQLVINTMNKLSYPSARVSGMMNPSGKPLPPVAVSIENVRNGIKLTWKSLEYKIEGCIVFRCNGYKGKMFQVSNMIKPATDLIYTWTDTSGILNGKGIYSYAVKTVSLGNTLSIFSDTVSITSSKPIGPPMAPIHLKVKPDKSGIYISWDDMSRLDPFITGYNIYRKELNDGKKESTQSIKLNYSLLSKYSNLFFDTTAVKGINYRYSAESEDIFGNKSAMSYPASASITIIKPASPGGLKVYREGDNIILKWDGVIMDDLAGYKVYRSLEGKTAVLIYTSKPDETNYMDKDTKKDKLYFYYITSFNKTGQESEQGNEVSLRK